MRKIFLVASFLLCPFLLFSQTGKREQVLLSTSKGEIVVELFNETPQHRDNFLRLVREGLYDGVLFHRVINNFMVQAGDLSSRHAAPGQSLGEAPEKYQIPAEIVFPKFHHRRGMLAAAREGDVVNPERASSMSQFYIVWGRTFSDAQLDQQQLRIDQQTGGKAKLSPEMRESYKTIGGTPHLDGQYTVYGEVVKGLDIVNLIQLAATDENDRPIEDIRVVSARILSLKEHVSR